jgi:hypothetical protein
MLGLTKIVLVTVSLASLLSGGVIVALTGGPGPEGGADYGLDVDGDGAFDWLVVRMAMTVDTPDWYNVWATLGTDQPSGRGCGQGGVAILGGSNAYPPDGGRGGVTTTLGGDAYPISWASVRQFLETGEHQISLAFKGTDIGYAGVDGPYAVHAQVYRDGEWDSRIMDPAIGAPIPGPTPSGWEWSYETRAYDANAFEQPRFAIRFSGERSDSGVDRDGDGLIDYLMIEAQADVALAGTYSIGASLFVAEGEWGSTWIAGTWGSVDFREGLQTIEYRFNGADIWASGRSGAFDFTLDAWYGGGFYLDGTVNGTIREGEPYPPQTDGFDVYGDHLCGVTSEYRHEQFEERVEPAKYTGVYADFGEDYDEDGLFDALVVQAEVEVTEANLFDFSGQLVAGDGSLWIGGAWEQVYLDVGVHMLALRFPGPDIRRSGIDGPYRVDLNLVVANRDPATTIFTAAYRHTDFDGDDQTRGMHWIANLTADGTAIAVLVVRGLDMLDFVIEDVLGVEAYASTGEVVFQAREKVYLASGGDSQSFTFAWSPTPGTYVVRATLGSPDQPNGVIEIVVTV